MCVHEESICVSMYACAGVCEKDRRRQVFVLHEEREIKMTDRKVRNKHVLRSGVLRVISRV